MSLLCVVYWYVCTFDLLLRLLLNGWLVVFCLCLCKFGCPLLLLYCVGCCIVAHVVFVLFVVRLSLVVVCWLLFFGC